jgi:serine/threonine protein phosphatase PrpC
MQTKGTPIQRSGESRFLERFRLDCSMLTAAAVGRPRNEDACLLAGPGTPEAEAAAAGYLFAVIDGEFAGGKGGAAARETRSSLLEILEDPRVTALRPDLLMHRLQDANDRCHRFIEGRCAATAVWIWEEPGSSSFTVAWAHVGDTRLYHHGRDGWRCLTKDHAKGRLLDRAIGQGPGLEVATGERRFFPGEWMALVTDGVWRTTPPCSVLPREPFPATAESVRRLIGTARLNDGRDDTSAIVIRARTIDADPEPEH